MSEHEFTSFMGRNLCHYLITYFQTFKVHTILAKESHVQAKRKHNARTAPEQIEQRKSTCAAHESFANKRILSVRTLKTFLFPTGLQVLNHTIHPDFEKMWFRIEVSRRIIALLGKLTEKLEREAKFYVLLYNNIFTECYYISVCLCSFKLQMSTL